MRSPAENSKKITNKELLFDQTEALRSSTHTQKAQQNPPKRSQTLHQTQVP